MTISSRVELVARRRLVDAFIKADPVTVVLSRQGDKIQSAAGGHTRPDPSDLDPQQVAIIPGKRRWDSGLVNSEAGDIPVADYYILGRHTLDIRADDEFTWLANGYKIESVHPIRNSSATDAESVLAVMKMRGPTNA